MAASITIPNSTVFQMRDALDAGAIFHRGFERCQSLAATFRSHTTGGLARIAI
jgi:hypothetical protein